MIKRRDGQDPINITRTRTSDREDARHGVHPEKAQLVQNKNRGSMTQDLRCTAGGQRVLMAERCFVLSQV
jgi:hypothetical protein